MAESTKHKVRVRFAPSPTGFFSLASARTALFNWLFARHEGGVFLLRIEDTDKVRSKPEYDEDILKSLEWLGLTWDEPEVRQSDRLKIYEKHLKKLLEEKKAYYCFCTPEELDAERQAQLSQGLPPKYSGRCKSLAEDEVKKRLSSENSVIRFRVASREVTFSDMIRGSVSFDTGLMGDIVIAKNLKEPLYNFAVVIDDFDMEVTHVIRGEDHISNTPKQILIQEALGFPMPHYAHLPLLLGPDKKKLSKRYADASLRDYITRGYIRDAMLNFLVLLGWHPERDREVLNSKEMIEEFSLRRVQKSGAIFNPEKLEWLNGSYLREMDAAAIVPLLRGFVPESWSRDQGDRLLRVVELEKERMKRLSDLQGLADFFFETKDYPQAMLLWKGMDGKAVKENLLAVKKIISAGKGDVIKKEALQKVIQPVLEEKGRGEVLWPFRVALSGKEASPDPLDIASILGKKETLARLHFAIEKLQV